MYKNLPPKSVEEHIGEAAARLDRLERRIPKSSIELYVQSDPPARAGYGAFWLEIAP